MDTEASKKDNDKVLTDEATDKLQPDWTNAPKLSDLKQDVNDAASDHDRIVSRIDLWQDNLNITGKARVRETEGFSSIQPKLIRKQAEWRYSSLSEPFLSTEDLFNVDPVTFEDKNAAIQNGLVLNNQFNTKIQKVRFINDYIRAAVDEGTVLVKTGWEFQEEEREVGVIDFEFLPSADPADIEALVALDQLAQEDAIKFKMEVPDEVKKAYELSKQSGQVIKAVQIGTHIETKLVTTKNHPTVEVCDYCDVVVDPTALGDINKANFVKFTFETNKSELEKDGKYSNIDKINVDANSILGTPDHRMREGEDTSFNFSDEPRKKMVAHEYWGFWDINGDGETVAIVATWVGETLIRLEKNPFPDQGLPLVIAQYLPIRRSLYGEPDGVLLEDNQRIIGAVTRGMIDIMGRSANGQQGTRKDALDTVNRRKFEKGLDYEFNSQVDPKQAFHMHTYPEIPNSAGLMIQMQNAEAESLTGVKAFSGGISGTALGDTATGIRSALDATSKRELDILRRLAQGIIEIGRKFVAMNAVFLDETEIIRITNEEFIPVKRDDLAGNIDLSLSISTPESDNEKAQELAFMLQTTSQSMGPEFSQIILANIARLRKMPVLAKEITAYEPKPDPLAEEIKQLEIAKLEAEIAKIQSETVENNSSAQLDQVKQGTEVAKANELNTRSDKNNLDFVEQEGGTKHARDVDKITSQAEAQTKMKIVESNLNSNKE